MLNLTFMFTGKPHQIVGGRKVDGYAMSGSPACSDINETEIDRKIKATPKPTTQKVESKRPMSPAEVARKYGTAMKGRGWMGTAMVAEFAGVSKEAASHHLRRLLLADKVERIRELGVKGNKHHVKYLWRWKE